MTVSEESSKTSHNRLGWKDYTHWGQGVSGPLWTDPQSELQVSDSVRFMCPLSRQPANHEDSKAISGLTTNGRRFFDNTHSNPFKGTDCCGEYVRF